jgi:hypothetical protein
VKTLLLGAAALLGLAAPAPKAPSFSDPGEATGGAWYTCPALGAVFGLQIATGNVVGSVATLVQANEEGCLW